MYRWNAIFSCPYKVLENYVFPNIKLIFTYIITSKKEFQGMHKLLLT